MEFFTRVSLSKAGFSFSYADEIILLGSCFAEHIGKLLGDNKFNVDLNPFGILYNPASVAKAIRRLIRPEKFTEADIFTHEGVYHSFMHHSRFSALSAEEMLENINNNLAYSGEKLRRTSRMVVTLGTAYAYRLKSDGQVVANCHKLPEKMFTRQMLTVEEIAGEWEELLAMLREHNPRIKVLFTVSPIRHWKDGAHENQLSKATLLLAIDRLQKAYPEQTGYFPAYEIVMDELRDYRFYAEDMLHPSRQTIDYIWQRFTENHLSPEALSILNEWQEIGKAINHKPFQPDSVAYKQFIHQTLLKVEHLHQKFPYFDLENEKRILHQKLKGE